MEAASPKDIDDFIDGLNGEPLDVEINSGGGSVFAGSKIYTSLKSYVGTVNVTIPSIAASAASVAAMAGDNIEISPTAQIMIHNVSSVAVGDYREMEHEAEIIKNYNTSIANAYQLKTGMKQDELLKLMDNETWLNAQQAKELGFADNIMFDGGRQLAASIGGYVIPNNIVNKIRNTVINKNNHRRKPKVSDPSGVDNNENNENNENVTLCKAKLNLLKLGVM
jgi:ATP-dependent protease ClpP protease subunit